MWSLQSTLLHVSGLWEETGAPGEIRVEKANSRTQHVRMARPE